MLIKPRCDSGSTGVKVVYNREELEAVFERTPKPLIEEYVEGEEFTVDCADNLDNSIIGIVPRKRLQTRGVSAQRV
ncbi:MAG: ATP-grasp domain-containing protein [Vulcanimicrobiota bacterium]